jgi:hypothetical protein
MPPACVVVVVVMVFCVYRPYLYTHPASCVGKYGPYPKAENDPTTDALAVGIVDYNTVKFVTHE